MPTEILRFAQDDNPKAIIFTSEANKYPTAFECHGNLGMTKSTHKINPRSFASSFNTFKHFGWYNFQIQYSLENLCAMP